MNLLKDRQLPNLFQAQPFPCVSIYMDLGVTPGERRSAPSRLRALIRAAGKAVAQAPEASGQPLAMASFDTRAMASLRDLPEGSRGVALFQSARTAGLYPIGHQVAEVVAVADTFHLKPLLPLIQGHDEFFTVVLSHRLIRLYRGNEHRLVLLETFSAPEEDLDYQWSQPRFRRERLAPRGKVARYPVARIPAISKVEDFVRRIEEKIRQRLKGRTAPVVLTGSPLLRRFYRMACGHGQLVSEEVAATFGVNEKRAIHKATWPIARKELARRSSLVASTFRRLSGTDHASDELAEIAKEALRGRVGKLLISKDDQIFGRLDRSDGSVTPLSLDRNGIGDDVLCDIAQEVLLRDGSAYLLAKHEMPTRSPIAAIYRW